MGKIPVVGEVESSTEHSWSSFSHYLKFLISTGKALGTVLIRKKKKSGFLHPRPPVDCYIFKAFKVPPEVMMHLRGFGLAESFLCLALPMEVHRHVLQCILKLL